MRSDHPHDPSRRDALKCLAAGSAGTLFMLSGGVLTPMSLARAAQAASGIADAGTPLFLQISDTHIGFKNPAANPDVAHTLDQTIDMVNAMPAQPALIIHTGDITHLSKPEEFDLAAQHLSRLKVAEMHTVPGEHDVTDGTGAEYFKRYGKASGDKGYYSFDHQGVHFIALVNVMHFKNNGLGDLGADQIAWLERDLKGRPSSTPIVVFAHMPLWTIHEPWGWGTSDAAQATSLLQRFGSVTVINGHIHQIVSKVEGNITFHTARSTAYPQPEAGQGKGPGPLVVPAEQLPAMLGVTTIQVQMHPAKADLRDTALAQAQAGPSVEIRDFSFEPTALTIKSGQTVTWKNRDDEPHVVVDEAGSFRSPALDTDDTWQHKFDKPGVYKIFCGIHPSMREEVRVV
jgi:plastocyanin